VAPWEILITGAVGIAGIGGTLWQGKRSREAQTTNLKASLDATTENLKLGINADNEHARLAERRRVYARCLAVIDNLYLAGTKEVTYRGKVPHEAMIATMQERQESLTSLYGALSELELIATVKVMFLANEIMKLLLNYKNLKPSDYNNLRNSLRQAMRADLGESV
jgi:hypothetical protein